MFLPGIDVLDEPWKWQPKKRPVWQPKNRPVDRGVTGVTGVTGVRRVVRVCGFTTYTDVLGETLTDFR